MSARKREPRAVTIAEIERTFELASYWWGREWCPAVHAKDSGGYGIRVIKSLTISGARKNVTYDYFELDPNGVITAAPYGYARDFKPGQVADIETWAERMAAPDPDAERITFGGAW